MNGTHDDDYFRPGRAESRARALLDEAERLISQRAAKLGVKPQTVINAVFPDEEEAEATRADREKDGVVGELLKRLAVRDNGNAL